MMSGNDCWNKNVFSRWRKVAIDGDDWTWTGNVFQTIATATWNERRPVVVRRYDRTNSSSAAYDRRRRQPGRSDTERADSNTPVPCMPCHTRYAISASLKFERSGWYRQRWHGCSYSLWPVWSHAMLEQWNKKQKLDWKLSGINIIQSDVLCVCRFRLDFTHCETWWQGQLSAASECRFCFIHGHAAGHQRRQKCCWNRYWTRSVKANIDTTWLLCY